MPWLLVVGCYEQSSRLCVRDEGNCATRESHNIYIYIYIYIYTCARVCVSIKDPILNSFVSYQLPPSLFVSNSDIE